MENYTLIKALHLISVIAWMAGLLYLPRLYVYHAENAEEPKLNKTFKTMERRLMLFIMNPAMIAAWAFGFLLLTRPGFALGAGFWLWTKLALVVILSCYHGFLAAERKKFLTGVTPHSSRFYRMINEIPPVLTVFIVIMAVVKPF